MKQNFIDISDPMKYRFWCYRHEFSRHWRKFENNHSIQLRNSAERKTAFVKIADC